MAIKTFTRKWGNSIGVVLPKEFVEKQKIKENQEIIINVIQEADLSNIFGIIKKRKMSGQKMKDLARKEWE